MYQFKKLQGTTESTEFYARYSLQVAQLIRNDLSSGNLGLTMSTTYDVDELTKSITYPIIVLINGSAACGKGTLIDLIRQYSNSPVYELSTVDPCRGAARYLMAKGYDVCSDLIGDQLLDVDGVEKEKGGAYRQLLSDLKKAWSAYYDGPNNYAVGAALQLITNRHCTIKTDRYMNVPCIVYQKEYPMPGLIFVNAREPENLDTLKKAYHEVGLLCMTMYVMGRDIPKVGGAECDYHVGEYDYDLIVDNSGTMDDLSVTAFRLARLFDQANRYYGTSRIGIVNDFKTD